MGLNGGDWRALASPFFTKHSGHNMGGLAAMKTSTSFHIFGRSIVVTRFVCPKA